MLLQSDFYEFVAQHGLATAWFCITVLGAAWVLKSVMPLVIDAFKEWVTYKTKRICVLEQRLTKVEGNQLNEIREELKASTQERRESNELKRQSIELMKELSVAIKSMRPCGMDIEDLERYVSMVRERAARAAGQTS